MSFHRNIWQVLGWIALVGPSVRAAADEDVPRFDRDVRPILTAHCLKCHGLEDRKAGLDLRTATLLFRGGERGPVAVAGSAEKSKLFQKIASRAMPPAKELPLTESQIAVIRRWLDVGAAAEPAERPPAKPATALVTAKDRQFWAYQKLGRPAPPSVRRTDRVRNPVDRFVLAQLEPKGLSPAKETPPRLLARRAYLDLIGLPPAPGEMAAFLADSSPLAYEKMVDRLLASPHFGERWGRHWLDAAGYTDTIGDDTDAAITKQGPGKWRYRDYVIRSFNGDKPFDRFLVEQLAGDELFDWRAADGFTDEQRDWLVATGFLRTVPDETLQNELNTADIRHAVLQRTLEVSLGAALGLTIGCARCHDHKYDPIPQDDYYRLLAVFTPAYNPQAWLQPGPREIADVPPAEKRRIEAHNSDLDREIAQISSQRTSIRKPAEERLYAAKLARVPEPIRADCAAALKIPAAKRNDVQKYLAAKFEAALKVAAEEVTAALTPADRDKDRGLIVKSTALAARKRSWGKIQAVYDVGAPPPTYLLRRGNHETPGQEVTPGFLRVLDATDADSKLIAKPPYAATSGRRLALAKTLTDPHGAAAALVARVHVNRIWQQLFGQGLVATSDNFGQAGARPTHPELLDWLAVEFMRAGWRIKPLLRMLLTSSTYRQSSRAEANGSNSEEPDPSLLYRQALRPLEAEIVRDAMLAVSGLIDQTMNGAPIPCVPQPGGIVRIDNKALPTPQSRNRRSVYLQSRRRYHLSFLEVFDQPEVAGSCMRRIHAPVVGQALTLLNDPFVADQASAFAARVLRDQPNDPIGRAFQLALCRPAEADERAWADELVRRQSDHYRAASKTEADLKALTHLCHMLFNSSEFLYVP